jgi:hypothetical protein
MHMALCTILFLGLSGCGPNRPATVPVSGKVTFDGKPPPAAGALYFRPKDLGDGKSKRPAPALFDTSGRYEVSAWEGTKGLVPGTYMVGVECWKSLPTMDGKPGVSYVAKDFKPPELVVKPDEDSISFDVNVKLAP